MVVSATEVVVTAVLVVVVEVNDPESPLQAVRRSASGRDMARSVTSSPIFSENLMPDA